MSENFLEELLAEAEVKEEERTEAWFDLLLLQIQQLQNQIAYNFNVAEKECSMINGFIIHKNAQLQEKVRWLEIKLEAFIRERKEKTIDLTHGTLKLHKKQDKIEISDMELFIKHAKAEMLTVIPESVKPNLNKIKAFIKQRVVPKGVTVSEGKEEFTYKLRKEENENGEEEIRTPTQHPQLHRIAL